MLDRRQKQFAVLSKVCVIFIKGQLQGHSSKDRAHIGPTRHTIGLYPNDPVIPVHTHGVSVSPHKFCVGK